MVKSFLTSSSPETVSQEKKKKKDLLEKMAEKNKRLKELELKRQKEQEERIKYTESLIHFILDQCHTIVLVNIQRDTGMGQL